jgi:hypothetical protein
MTTKHQVEDQNTNTLQSTEKYSAPRLVRLGDATKLVQGSLGKYGDNPSAPYQGRHG